MEEPNWEVSKENVLPVRRGRSAKGLQDSQLTGLIKPSPLPAQQEQQQSFDDGSSNNLHPQEVAFEAELAAADASADGEATLQIFVRYLKWTRENNPTAGQAKCLKILERCTFELKNIQSLRNNPTFVKMWIEYADAVRTPGEIFSFMQTNKIGERVALFWIAWAFVAEKAANYKLTDQIFQKGARRLAEPKELLTKRYHQFQRRMARQFLNNFDDGSIGEGGNGGSSGSMVFNAAIGAAGVAAAIAATASVTSSNSTQDANGNQRRALHSVDGRSGANNRGLSSVVIDENSAGRANQAVSRQGAPVSASRTVNRSSQRQQPAAPSASQRRVERQNRGQAPFQIFSDNNETPGGTFSIFQDEPGNAATWKHLPSEEQRRKENDGPVTAWSEGPLSARSSDARHASTAMVASQSVSSSMAPAFTIFSDEPLDSHTSSVMEEVSLKQKNSSTGLSVRRKLDSMELNAERIAKHPLARHTSTVTSTTKPSKNAVAEDVQTQKSTVEPTTKMSSSNDEKVSAVSVSQSVSEPEAVVNSQLEEDPIEETNVVSKKVSSENESKQVDHAAHAQSTKDEEAELEQMLAQMVDLDTEDGTINTRIARRDIDSLFCSSPSPIKTTTRNVPPTQAMPAVVGGAPFMIFDENAPPLTSEPHNVVHRPFGTQLSDQHEFSAFKDLSVIKESSQEFSLCGTLLVTPGATDALNNKRSAHAVVREDKPTQGKTHSSGISEGRVPFSIFEDSSEPCRDLPSFQLYSDSGDRMDVVQETCNDNAQKGNSDTLHYSGLAGIRSRRRLYRPLLSISSVATDLIAGVTVNSKASITCLKIDGKENDRKESSFHSIYNPLHTSQTDEVTETLNVDVFNVLDRASESFIIQVLQAQNTGTRRSMLLFDMRDAPFPRCLQISNLTSKVKRPRSESIKRAKSVENSIYIRPSVRWNVLKNLGNGSFARAVLLQEILDSDGELPSLYAAKIARNHAQSVLWEAFIHYTILQRIGKNEQLIQKYEHLLCTPQALYLYRSVSIDSSWMPLHATVLLMPYGDLGTLIDVLKVLHTGGFTPKEIEYLAAYLTKQMVEGLRLLHEVDMMHCDIKTDNWVLREIHDDHGTNKLQMSLIDFGKARSITITSKTIDQNYASSGGSVQLQQLLQLYNRSESKEERLPVKYSGVVAAAGYRCNNTTSYWSEEVDHYALCCCIHQLLYYKHMECVRESIDYIRRRNFSTVPFLKVQQQEMNHNDKAFIVPLSTLRRYWQQEYWSQVYALLLNSQCCKDKKAILLDIQLCLEQLLELPIFNAVRENAVSRLTQQLKQH